MGAGFPSAQEIENDLELRNDVWPFFLHENTIRVFKLEQESH